MIAPETSALVKYLLVHKDAGNKKIAQMGTQIPIWANFILLALKLQKHRRGCRWLLPGPLPPGGRRYSMLWKR